MEKRGGVPTCQSTTEEEVTGFPSGVDLRGSDPAVRGRPEDCGQQADPRVKTVHPYFLAGHHRTVVNFTLQSKTLNL